MPAKVVIITGASRGIGLAISHCLLKQSCRIVVVSRSKEPLEKLQIQYKDQVEVLAGDLADLSLGQKAVDAALSRWGSVDGLIVNHGRLEPVERIADANLEEWRAGFDINYFSAVAIVKAAIPALRATKGTIVLCSSGAAVKGTSTWGCYSATKGALNNLALTLAQEEPSITSLAIRPGVVDTEMQKSMAELHHSKMDQDDAARFRQMKSEGKFLRPEQPGNVMAKLAINGPKALNGKFLSWNDEELRDYQD